MGSFVECHQGKHGEVGRATMNGARAKLVARQAERLRNRERRMSYSAKERSKRRVSSSATNAQYANVIGHELDLFTRPSRKLY